MKKIRQFDNYEKTAKTKINLENIQKTIGLIITSGLDHEFRTTMVPGLVSKPTTVMVQHSLMLGRFLNTKINRAQVIGNARANKGRMDSITSFMAPLPARSLN